MPYGFEERLKETEAAEALGISVKTLQKWRWERKGPDYVKMGRLVSYPVSSLKKFIEERTITLSN